MSEPGGGFENFASKRIYRNATAICVIRTGFLSESLNRGSKERHSRIRWDKISGINDTFNADAELDVEKVWLEVTDDIPVLKALYEQELGG